MPNALPFELLIEILSLSLAGTLGLVSLLNILPSLERFVLHARDMNDDFLGYLSNLSHLPRLKYLSIHTTKKSAITGEGLQGCFSHRAGGVQTTNGQDIALH